LHDKNLEGRILRVQRGGWDCRTKSSEIRQQNRIPSPLKMLPSSRTWMTASELRSVDVGSVEDPPREPRSLNGEPSNRGVVGDNPCWSFGDARREFDGDGRKRVINSGISAIGFNFLKDLTIRTLLSIEVVVMMKYKWNLRT
jgi:hypothetical protein